MYFVCTKCHRLFRDVNASKHVNKCRGTTFRCVDCDEEFCVQDIPQHTDCPKAMKSLVPPLYNPKSVSTNSGVSTLRIIDRMVYENKDESLKPVFDILAKTDNIPTKEKGFVTFMQQTCHADEETGKKLYREMQEWRKKEAAEVRNYRHHRKEVSSVMKKEAKKVDRQRKTQQMKEEKKSEEAQPPKEKKDTLEKKSEVNPPLETTPNKYEKQVAKLIRQNMDNYKQRDALLKAVIDIIHEKEDSADVQLITEAFDKKYATVKH